MPMIYDRSDSFLVWDDEKKIATHMRLTTASYFIWYLVTDDGYTAIDDDEEAKRLEAAFQDGDYRGDAK
jgi:hypothetical protein